MLSHQPPLLPPPLPRRAELNNDASMIGFSSGWYVIVVCVVPLSIGRVPDN